MRNTIFLAFTIILLSANIRAAVYSVTNTNDSGAGSLRAAVLSANTTVASDVINIAIPLHDPNCTAVGVCTIKLTSGELTVTTAVLAGSLTISNSTSAANLLISGNNSSRVFYTLLGSNLTLQAVTITGGNGTGASAPSFNNLGGGIYNRGTLTLNNSSVSGNSAQNIGGGIYNDGGILTLNNSTVSGNSSAGSSGGIVNTDSSTLNLTNSTVSNNTANTGGGITNNENSNTTITNSIISGNSATVGGGILNASGGNLTISNSTISNNSVTGTAGGIYNEHNAGVFTINNSTINGNSADGVGGIFNANTATLNNSTVSGNTSVNGGSGIFNRKFPNSGAGILNLNSVTVTNNSATSTSSGCFITDCVGGIDNAGGIVNLKNSIVAGNTSAHPTSSPDIGGQIQIASSYNIIGNNKGTSGVVNGFNANQVGTPSAPIDPRLEPLGDYGGATETHMLKFDSPAIDKGNSFGLTEDQRGNPRPVDLPFYPNATLGNGADIGAFEVQMPLAAGVLIGGRVSDADGRGIFKAVVNLIDQNGNIRSAWTNQFGFYEFQAVEAGQTVVLSVETRQKILFTEPLKIIFVSEDTADINFVAIAEERKK